MATSWLRQPRFGSAGIGGVGGQPQQVGQDGGLAVVDVSGGGEQDQRSLSRGERAQPAEGRSLRGPGELGQVAPAELVEQGRPAHRRRGRHGHRAARPASPPGGSLPEETYPPGLVRKPEQLPLGIELFIDGVRAGGGKVDGAVGCHGRAFG
jgi:hypothetical protein